MEQHNPALSMRKEYLEAVAHTQQAQKTQPLQRHIGQMTHAIPGDLHGTCSTWTFPQSTSLAQISVACIGITIPAKPRTLRLSKWLRQFLQLSDNLVQLTVCNPQHEPNCLQPSTLINMSKSQATAESEASGPKLRCSWPSIRDWIRGTSSDTKSGSLRSIG